jgi:alkylhydroperoxidase family enzyme
VHLSRDESQFRGGASSQWTIAGAHTFAGVPARAALSFAEGMTQTPVDASDEVFAEAQRHFSNEQLVELAATVAMENYCARFNRASHVESQHFYRPHSASRD